MKLPRDVYGTSLAKHRCKLWGYRIVHQTGSHIILDTDIPSPHRISIPSHKPIRIGTLGSILAAVATHRQATREDVLREL